jgi:hypothetical protein
MKTDKSDIARYIQTEKDLSRFKIMTLERLKDISPSKKRIIEIEKEFLSLPLEKWGFEDMADVASAISIYRSSRSLFYKTYNMQKPNDISTDEIKNIVNSKISFIKEKQQAFLFNMVDEMNLVQNEELFSQLAITTARMGRKNLLDTLSELEAMNLDELNAIEPIILSKDRARKQATLFSIGLYLSEELSIINSYNTKSRNDLINISNYIDGVIERVNKNIFKYYNDALDVLPIKFNNSMGKNAYFGKIHYLKNILNFDYMMRDLSDNPIINSINNFNFNNPMILNLDCSGKRTVASVLNDKNKRAKSRTFGILLPIQRVGNEKMTIMYTHVRACEEDITDIFEDNISNIKVQYMGELTYFKSIMLKPIWQLLDYSYNNDLYEMILSRIIKTNIHDAVDLHNISDTGIVDDYYERSLLIDRKSQVLVPKTRSEEDAFIKLSPWVNMVVSGIKEEYYSTTNEAD